MATPPIGQRLSLTACSQVGWRAPLAVLRAVLAAGLVATLAVNGTGTAAARVIGPDVSSHNHDNRGQVSWRIMHNVGGASFAFIKATEGRDYYNPHFAGDFAASGRHHIYRGAYHFAHPGGRNRSQIVAEATGEANFFIVVTGTLTGPGNLPPVLDLEDSGNLTPTQLALWCRTWLGRVKALTGRTPILYTYGSFWRDHLRNSRHFAAYPLWLASYGVPRPARLGGWRSYTFWQYTETGRMAGSGSLVDLSVFRGSRSQLAALSSRKSAPTKMLGDVVGSVSPGRHAKPGEPLREVSPAKPRPPKQSETQLRLQYLTRADTSGPVAQRDQGTGQGGASTLPGLGTSAGMFGMDGSRVFGGP